MSIKLGVIMDPIEKVNFKKDSTLAMLWAAQERNWELHYFLQEDLFIEAGQAFGTGRKLQVSRDANCWYEFEETATTALAELDAILMRKDPPFNMAFIYTTYILEIAEQAGTLIVNKPQSLRDCNEKVFATWFPQCCTPTLVSANSDKIRQFAEQHRDLILKPLDGMGGASIFRTGHGDGNLSVIIETLTERGSKPAMAQRFIPEINKGDKRILIIDGEPMPYCLARIPAENEVRGNLAAGGTGVVQPLSERDRWICAEVSAKLREKQLLFVGLDIIGDYLTEINVTSPTCIREIENHTDLKIADKLMTAIAARLQA